MSQYFDLLLHKPLHDGWLRSILFASFALHFAFVLFTVGTAILALTYYVRSRFGGDTTVQDWDKHFLSSFFVHKSVAIVLGVGPILIMQVGNSVPFVTAGNLFAPLWMGLILFLLTALILLEALHERKSPGRWGYLAVGVIGLAALLAVPATFAAVVSTTERPSTWPAVFRLAGMPRALAVHWILRLLHVVGAAVVFTAALHLIHGRYLEKRAALGRWIMGGIAVQVPLGVALFMTLPSNRGLPINTALVTGIISAVAVVWALYRSAQGQRPLRPRALTAVLLVLLMAMLLTRQFLQDRVLVPVDRQLAINAQAYRATLGAQRAQPLAAYRTISEVPYDNPLTIYARSCHVCHGAVGNGLGPEAGNLLVAPEDLTNLRLHDQELRRILRHGIPGSAMPEFGFYTDKRLDELMGFLRNSVGLAAMPEPMPVQPSNEARLEANRTFADTCATCHGPDGRGAALSRPFMPPPPDLTKLSLSPARDFQVLTEGYPGTMMPSFASLPESTRWALVERARSLYQPR